MGWITLVAGGLRASIAPELGAGIADFSVRGPGAFYFPIMRRAAPEETNASLLGSFIMAPWANRIRGGRFAFAGREVALRTNTPDGMAQHGDVRKRAWRTVERTGSSMAAEYESGSVSDSNWAWAYSCRVEYALDEAGLSVLLSVTNADREAFPAGCGLHPYFMRRLWADGDVLEVRAPVGGRYPLENGCAAGPAAADDLTGRLARSAVLPDEHIDAVFAGFGGEAELRWPRSGVRLRFAASKNLGHLVVYAPLVTAAGEGGPEKRPRSDALSFVAVEPQTHVNDAFNLGNKGVGGTGTVVLKPGETLRTECRFEVTVGG
jgi:aldose 1-epimerase